MNKNDAIKSIKDSLKKLFSSIDQKFSDFVLTDGTKITTTASELEIGSEVYLLDDQGNQSPLNNGEYVLQDGRTITVEDNKVTNISGGETTEDESPASDANTSSKQEMQDGLAEKPAEEGDLSQRVTDLEAQLDEILTLLKQMSDGQTKTNEQMMSKIRMIGSEPGGKAIKTSKTDYEAYSTKNINAKKNISEIEELRKIINEKHKRDNNMSL